jgi:hypothetical protein
MLRCLEASRPDYWKKQRHKPEEIILENTKLHFCEKLNPRKLFLITRLFSSLVFLFQLYFYCHVEVAGKGGVIQIDIQKEDGNWNWIDLD